MTRTADLPTCAEAGRTLRRQRGGGGGTPGWRRCLVRKVPCGGSPALPDAGSWGQRPAGPHLCPPPSVPVPAAGPCPPGLCRASGFTRRVPGASCARAPEPPPHLRRGWLSARWRRCEPRLPGPALSRCVSCGRAPVGSHSLGTGTRPTLSVAQPGGLRPLRDHGSSKATLPCPALHPTLCPPYSPPEANGAPHICRRLPPKEPQGLLRSPGQAVRPLLPLLPTSCFGIPAPRSARRSRAPRWAAPGRGLCGLHALPLCHWQGVGGRAVAPARAWLRLEAMLL